MKRTIGVLVVFEEIVHCAGAPQTRQTNIPQDSYRDCG